MTRAALFICALTCLALALRVVAQAPDATEAALTQQLADQRSRLGACNAELGPLQQLHAQVIAGQVRPVADTQAAIVATVEAANPGQTLDLKTGKLVAKVPMK